MKTLIIDNYDSYTFNLFQLISEVNGEEATVVRNDEAGWPALRLAQFDNVVISPGPGRPERPSDFGVSADALNLAELPVLGVCLGHQGLGYLHGGRVAHAPEPVHGRLSAVWHDGSALFAGIPQGFRVVRYHSLVVVRVPGVLSRTAWTADGIVMALAHRDRPHWGVQFHPESVCTEYGGRLLENFRDLSRPRRRIRATRRPRRRIPAPARPRRTADPSTASPPSPPPSEIRVLTHTIDRLIDPETAFVHLYGRKRYAFWLDSSLITEERSRFSFMGASGGPLSRIVSYDVARRQVLVREGDSLRRHAETLFDYVARETARMRCEARDLPFDFAGGFVGCLGYELRGDCGSLLRHPPQGPAAVLLLADRVLAFDHRDRSTYLICLVRNGAEAAGRRWLRTTSRRLQALAPLGAPPPAPFAQSVTFAPHRERERYLETVHACQREIVEGETYEVCLTNELRSSAVVDPLALYRRLRDGNPAPYAAFLRFGDQAVLSSSPERFLRIDRERWIEAKPIKGTAPRNTSVDADARARETLRSDEKSRAENLMIVDLLRNDLGRVSTVGSVSVSQLMEVESYQTVHQLVSTVRSRLRDDLSAVDCVRAAFPGGSMTGAPKLRTMEIIDRLEDRPRGFYSGALGFFGLNGTLDLSIVIRTLVVTSEGCAIGTGGAIVAQSEPEAEHEEMLLKARALIEAAQDAASHEDARMAQGRAGGRA